MPAGYVRAWITFLEALDHVEQVARCGRQEACEGLLGGLRDGIIASQFADTGEGIDSSKWARAEVYAPGMVAFSGEPTDRNRVGQWPSNRLVELRREDVESLWSAESSNESQEVAAGAENVDNTEPQLPSHGFGQGAVALLTTPSGIRITTDEKAEAACAEWLARLEERPRNKETAFADAKAAVAHVGTLSRKAFNRAWAAGTPRGWKAGGRRKGG